MNINGKTNLIGLIGWLALPSANQAEARVDAPEAVAAPLSAAEPHDAHLDAILSREVPEGLGWSPPTWFPEETAEELWTLAENLGSVESLVTHPVTMTHADVEPEERERVGIIDGLVRLSVGLEDEEDLIGALDKALAGV